MILYDVTVLCYFFNSTEEELIGGEDLDYEEYDLDEEEEEALLAEQGLDNVSNYLGKISLPNLIL